MTYENSWCVLKVTDDGMNALMCILATAEEEEPFVTPQMIMQVLEEQNIVYGINEVSLQALADCSMFGQYMCVARGTPALKGEDGHYVFTRELSDMVKKPLIGEDGTADYKNTLNIAIIDEGELLAEYIPAAEGTDGCDVYGNVLLALGKGKELLPLRGRGIAAGEDKNKYYAQYSGHIVMDGSRICIEKLYRVNGNVDIETGNIRFNGDVEISGDVRSGFEIDADGSIFIHGHVGGCILNAGKNITIEKGVQGRDTCVITAKGDVVCKFVERCKITAGNDIFADSVLDARLTASNKVIITSRNGSVIGSEVYGMTGVAVKEAGNGAGVSTLLRTGLPREEYVRAAELAAQIQETDEKLKSFNKHLESLETAGLEASEKGKMRTQIMRAKIVLNSQRSQMLEEYNTLSERIKKNAGKVRINIEGIVHEGVRIYIGSTPYYVMEPVREVTYMLQNDKIIATELVAFE